MTTNARLARTKPTTSRLVDNDRADHVIYPIFRVNVCDVVASSECRFIPSFFKVSGPIVIPNVPMHSRALRSDPVLKMTAASSEYHTVQPPPGGVVPARPQSQTGRHHTSR